DFHVTGVQTCALPIYVRRHRFGDALSLVEPVVLQATDDVEDGAASFGGRADGMATQLQAVEVELRTGRRAYRFDHGVVPHAPAEIGRASCRERVEWSV